jgi:hypothetical protein
MARERRGRDWQERAFEERENLRKDKKVGVASDVPDPMRISTDLPRRSSLRWTAAGLGVLIVAVLIHNNHTNHAPALATSCTTPAMALSTTSAHQGSNVRWSATGPAGTPLLITIGVASLKAGAKPGQISPVPEPGGRLATTEIAVRPGPLPSSCASHGEFSVGVPKGRYTVRLFRLTNAGTAAVTATSVAAKSLTVN